MAWHPVCKIADLNPEDVTPFDVGGTPVAVCIDAGRCHAFADLCSHESVALSGGFLEFTAEGPQIECPLHGARFCVRSGHALSAPASEPISVYPTKVEEGVLYVELGGA